MVKRLSFVLSGVSADKYELAKDTILEEFDKFKRGEFDVDKLELAKKLLFHIDMKLLIDRKVLSRSCRINCF